MGLSIRPVREQDAESIVAMLNPIILAGVYTILDEPVSVDDQVEFIRRFPDRGVYNVAICDTSQKVIGMQDVAQASAADRFTVPAISRALTRPNSASNRGISPPQCSTCWASTGREHFPIAKAANISSPSTNRFSS